jgi:Mrp family chromosome partitioning ATPase
MPTKEQVTKSLEAVVVQASKRSIVGLNLVREVNISDSKVSVLLASAGLTPEAGEWVKADARRAVEELPGVKEALVEFTEVKAKELNQIGHILAVMSGKGGVGKSVVSGLTAMALRQQGYQVGIMDADITGPSIPRMFGLSFPPGGNESGILPAFTESGIEVMSINLLLPSEDEAVIWRGPLIGSVIQQFGEDVLWGKLDYLIIDLPPGTADAPLTVLQTFPVSGVIIVFTPQDLTAMIVRKAVKMAQKMEKPVIGVVENMAYLRVPEINKDIEIFGPSRGEEMSRVAGAPLLARLPIDPALVRLCDDGEIEQYQSDAFKEFAGKLIETLTKTLKE